ncbi:DoxX family protein [Cellulosimicrobium composti]|uniref:DoxX family membrane protein n=1 Tax=Cellulosimicrobium composti TaxID=2672572 RepID=A0ABX0BEY6_9MICO|nr:membrane protein [Cellulosimicrobium composti]NDO90071.1 hypothetical protein [Cellulosimicrobium composti]TWG83407.1 putative membrane protein [Cellulosimicrobium cellulans J34]SMF16412.1 Uncharacterized membrane protein [Cellulosimicrobium cellulans J1]
MDLSAITRPAPRVPLVATLARVGLGLALVGAGVSHLTVSREEFQAQVPSWFPVDEDVTVLASGAVEIVLGASLVVLTRWRVAVGLVAAAFFVVIFPGNVGQWLEHKDGFGLDTDAKRFGRLFFQPVLVAWALWSTGALRALRDARSRD